MKYVCLAVVLLLSGCGMSKKTCIKNMKNVDQNFITTNQNFAEFDKKLNKTNRRVDSVEQIFNEKLSEIEAFVKRHHERWPEVK